MRKYTFYISKIQALLFENGNCRYQTFTFDKEFKFFKGTKDELIEYCSKKISISNNTETLNIVVVYGCDNITNRKDHDRASIELINTRLSGGEYFDSGLVDELETEQCSYFIDNRKTKSYNEPMVMEVGIEK